MPVRSIRKLRSLHAVTGGNQSAPKGHRAITDAHYSKNHLSLPDSVGNKLISNENLQIDDLPHNRQQHEHSWSKIRCITGSKHSKLKKEPQADSLEKRVLAQLSGDLPRSAKSKGDELREAPREHGSRMSLPWFNPLHHQSKDLQKSQHGLMSQPQQSISAQMATIHLPIQHNLLSTVNEDARNVLVYANRDMLWEEGSGRREDQSLPRRNRLDNPNYVAKRTEMLLRLQHRADTRGHPGFRAMRKKNLGLPVRRFTEQILGVINSNSYSIIDGGSRSGKTTQVPQIILDHAVNNSTGVSCRILCVQLQEKRAVSISRRVASERFEKLGDTTNFYSVRGPHDDLPPLPGGNITYCSRNSLLSLLKNGPSSLENFSHVILDDVQLRGFDIDVGMMLLKRFVEQRKSIGASAPKIILMGSIIDIDGLCSYFGTKTTDDMLLPAPHVTIPGNSPVKKNYLEEVIGKISHSLTPDILSPLLYGDNDTKEFLNSHFKLFDESDSIEKPKAPTAKINRLGKEPVPCGLVSATVLSLFSTTKTGSILVIVPGITHIQSVVKQIIAFGRNLGLDFTNKDRFRIIKLHAKTSNFEDVMLDHGIPRGCRRLIISTPGGNFKFQDVSYVVDSGKSNHENHEERTHLVQNLRLWGVDWISQTVAAEHAECAGSLQAREYYFLGAKKCFDSLPITSPLSTRAARSDLQQACLHVKRATSGTSLSIAKLLAQTYEPPQESSVCAAVDGLKELQALDEQEELTTLGRVLVNLNMDPYFGKMVTLGVVFQCLDPMLILASLGWDPRLALRSPSPPDQSYAGVGVSPSLSVARLGYHISIVNTFGAIRDMLHKKGKLPAFKNEFCKDYMSRVYHTAIPEIERIIGKMSAARIIPQESFRRDEVSGFSSSNLNANSNNEDLIKAVLLQCLSSKLAVKSTGDRAFKFKSGEIAQGVQNRSSIMACNFGSVSESMPYGMKQCSNLNPLAACLVGNKIEQEGDDIVMDSWVKIELQTTENTENEVARNLVQTHRVLGEALRTAFKVLPAERIEIFGSLKEQSSYFKARKRLFKTIQQTLQNILHANNQLPPTGSDH
ncbi:hypothetical protein PENVUL_c002G04144 [Penicillium vulpinum]|uniref:Helicase-associated domain-containing protein n=1 Tax=Penicillium vulpinum TaxID=29845 RepID=A0A1V6SC94_9EURO|nr:hypothetical protein PENVUL_c002G04144 [Penicillium vulpinum]